jgi:hypothetical protein
MSNKIKNSEESIEDVSYTELPDTDYTPFEEPVKERAYTTPKIDSSELVGELEEPTYEAPSFSDFDIEEEVETEKPEKEKKHQEQFNPSYNELGNKEKEIGAKMAAEMAIDAYSKIKGLIGNIAKISEDKINNEIAEGTIDPSIKLTIDANGNTVSIQEFAAEYNESIKEAFKTTDEFKESIKEPLIRIFKKRGIGVTDENLVYYLAITDISSGVYTGFSLRKNTNGIFENIREQTLMMKQSKIANKKAQRESEAAANSVREEQDKMDRKKPYEEPEEKIMTSQQIQKPSNGNAIKNQRDNENFSQDMPTDESMPKFGDLSVLKEIEKIAKNTETPKKKYTRKKAK